MNIISKVIFCVLILFKSVSNAHCNDFKLEQVQILVRHGDRTPDIREVYETDPYDPIMYMNPGYGQLTNTGKLRMYDFGQVLRQMYGSFLFDWRKIYTYSVDSDRIQDSLQQILAGIYPYLIINGNNIKNQIPTHTNTTLEDFFENYMLGTCPKFWFLLVRALREPKIQREVARNQKYFDHWKISTGFNFTRPVDVWFLFGNVRAVLGMNLPLPSWCDRTDFRKLLEMMVLYGYKLPVHTENLRRISAGPTINEFTNNIISGHGKNMYIYAAHDVNVGAFVRGLNLINAPMYPDFGNAAIVEKLRRIRDNQVFIRVLYWDSFTRTVIPLRFKKCGYMCPLERYMEMIEPLLPRSDDCRILN